MLHQHERTFSTFQKVLDALAVSLFWWISYYIRFSLLPDGQVGLMELFLKLTPVVILVTVLSFSKMKLYLSLRFSTRFSEVTSVFKANLLANVIFVIFIYFFGNERVSRLTIVIYFLVSTFGLIFLRLIVRNFLRSMRLNGKNLRHVVLVGNGPLLIDYIKTVKQFKDSGIRISGWFDSEGLAFNHKIDEVKSLSLDFTDQNRPDSIILAYRGEQANKSEEFIREHYNDVIPIQYLLDLSYSLVGHEIDDFGGIPLLAVNHPRIKGFDLLLKRLIDFILTLFGILLISPLLLLIAIFVKISSQGPIFYGQERVGLDGNIFKMWKFRSMKVATSGEDNEEWSDKDNPRKTKFGNFLRKTSLDELPQLWNVFIGDMSLVGPRPEQTFFVDKFRKEIAGYMLKHKMKPGITGWAQVSGWRGDTSIEKRIECDIYYIKHWSFLFDLKILFLTFWKGFIHKNAY